MEIKKSNKNIFPNSIRNTTENYLVSRGTFIEKKSLDSRLPCSHM